MRPIPLFLTILVLGLVQLASAISSATAQSVLKAHNQYRAKHGVPALKWSTKLEKYAQNWANQCKFQHTGGPYGENIAWGYSSFPAAAAAWYNEEKKYNYDKPGFTKGTGHFTAIVWKSTTEVGCGIKSCSNGARMYICSYAPAGNIVGNNNAYFTANVLPPK